MRGVISSYGYMLEETDGKEEESESLKIDQ